MKIPAALIVLCCLLCLFAPLGARTMPDEASISASVASAIASCSAASGYTSIQVHATLTQGTPWRCAIIATVDGVASSHANEIAAAVHMDPVFAMLGNSIDCGIDFDVHP